MTTPKSETRTNGLAEASKQVVTSTRAWARAARDAALAPAVELMEQHRSTEPWIRPWVATTTKAHDWLLATWEEASCQLIEQSFAAIDRRRV